jgi:hypothetical protein
MFHQASLSLFGLSVWSLTWRFRVSELCVLRRHAGWELLSLKSHSTMSTSSYSWELSHKDQPYSRGGEFDPISQWEEFNNMRTYVNYHMIQDSKSGPLTQSLMHSLILVSALFFFQREQNKNKSRRSLFFIQSPKSLPTTTPFLQRKNWSQVA